MMTDKDETTGALRPQQVGRRALEALAGAHLLGLLVWALLHRVVGDAWWPVAFFTAFAIWLFLPLPVSLAIAALSPRNRLLQGMAVAATLLFVVLFGGLFVPGLPSASASTATVRVLTYNVEGRNTDASAVLALIAAADADLIGIQELNPRLAVALAPVLDQSHPYQLLRPEEGTSGMGMYSRLPLTPLARPTSTRWVGPPQLATVSISGTDVHWLNAHFMVTNPYADNLRDYFRIFAATYAMRADNAAEVADWFATGDTPVLITADLNDTDLSDAYATIRNAGLSDAWRTAGFGFGHTFPAYARGFPPANLLRIDYVFYSPRLQVHAVERLPWDHVSDHRAVVAELSLRRN